MQKQIYLRVAQLRNAKHINGGESHNHSLLTISSPWLSVIQPSCRPVLCKILLHPSHKVQNIVTLIIILETVVPNVLHIFKYILGILIFYTTFEIATYCPKIHWRVYHIKIILFHTETKINENKREFASKQPRNKLNKLLAN